MNVEIGQCLVKNILDDRSMTITDLSIRTGIKPQQLSKYINDKTCMSLVTAKRVAFALNCTIDDLYLWHIE